MPISVTCECGRRLQARDEFAEKRAECPTCGRFVQIPARDAATGFDRDRPESATTAAAAEDESTYRFAEPEAMDIVDFVDPPSARPEAPAKPPAKPIVVRMLEALLDPRAIQWMLTIGGGLAVLGLIIWLVSLRVFEDPRIMAVGLGAASLGLLAGGWWITLKSRYRIAGQALTFLGCVVAPLNLWFYHAQGLVTLDQHLWIGGLACVALYAATVYVLRDPLFLYAVEAGVTLTVLLLMADLGMIGDAANLALFLVGLAFVSIHAERAFPPEGEFTRQRYGLPLFWSGHAQLGVALLVLLGSQVLGWLIEPLGLDWAGNLLTQNTFLAGGLWLAGMYLYFYSDFVVRRIGLYTSLAAVCLVMAQITLVLQHLSQEGVIAVLALTSLAVQLLQRYLIQGNDKLDRHGPAVSAILAELPVMMGVLLHVRATSAVVSAFGWTYSTGWSFVAAMVVVALCNRASAFLTRRSQPALSATYFFFSAAAVLVAAAGLLRQFEWTAWWQQSALLMLIPIAYIVASRLWRGHSPETPLARVAHVSTLVILLGTLVSALEHDSVSLVRPLMGQTANLLLGLTFLLATAFYILAGIFRRRSWNASLATAAACGALWQFLGYFGVATASYPVIYAALGLVGLVAARMLGLEIAERYRVGGDKFLALRGRGLTAFQSANGVLTTALVVAFLKGLAALAASRLEWFDLTMLLATTGAGLAAVWLVPAGGWRRWYTTATISLAAVTFLTLNVLINLSLWQKLEIFCVVIGLVLLVAGHVGRFREQSAQDDTVSLGLWLGSLLAVLPLFIATVVHRFGSSGPSLYDELALLAITVLMVVSGCSWRIKSTTLAGGVHLVLYLMILIFSLIHRPETTMGMYLLAGGIAVFAIGVVLSIYRDRLLAIPDQIAKREGLFRVIDWR